MAGILKVNKIAQLSGHNASVFALSADVEERFFLSGAGDGWIVRWDLDQPDLGRLLARVETQIFSLLYLPGYGRVVAGNMNGGMHWIELDRPEDTRNIAHHRQGVFGLCQVDEFLFSAGGEGLLTRWSAAEARTLESIHLSNRPLRSIAFSPERRELAVGASDGSIYLLDADTLALRRRLENAHLPSVFCTCYSPGGRYLLSGGRDAHLRIWACPEDFKLLSEQPAHWFTLNDIAFHPSGRWFATASRDKTIKIWDAFDFQLCKVLDTARDRGHVNSVNRLLWSAYHNYLLSAGDDRSLIIWQIEDPFLN